MDRKYAKALLLCMEHSVLGDNVTHPDNGMMDIYNALDMAIESLEREEKMEDELKRRCLACNMEMDRKSCVGCKVRDELIDLLGEEARKKVEPCQWFLK